MPPPNHSRSSQLREGKVADRTRTREENCVALSLAIRDGERAGEQGVKSEKNLTAETIASHRNRRVTDATPPTGLFLARVLVFLVVSPPPPRCVVSLFLDVVVVVASSSISQNKMSRQDAGVMRMT